MKQKQKAKRKHAAQCRNFVTGLSVEECVERLEGMRWTTTGGFYQVYCKGLVFRFERAPIMASKWRPVKAVGFFSPVVDGTRISVRADAYQMTWYAGLIWAYALFALSLGCKVFAYVELDGITRILALFISVVAFIIYLVEKDQHNVHHTDLIARVLTSDPRNVRSEELIAQIYEWLYVPPGRDESRWR